MVISISLINSNISIHILFILGKSKNILNDEFEVIEDIWKYFINEKIDIIKQILLMILK